MEKSKMMQFKGYEVKKLSIDGTKPIKKDVEENNLNIMYKIIPQDETFTKANVFQGVLIEATKIFPYEVEVAIQGNFQLSEEGTVEDKKVLLLQNAAAVLFPYVRSLVSLLTSQTNFNNLILPTMNFMAVIEDSLDPGYIFLGKENFFDFE